MKQTLMETVLRASPALQAMNAAERALLARYLEAIQYPAGTVVISQGARDRDMYFCLEGDARAVRDKVEVERLSAGDHFGELALILGRNRAASIVAHTGVTLARLTLENYQRLKTEQPFLGEKILEGIVGSMARRLTAMTDSVRHLLRERSLPRRTHVLVRLGDQVRHVETGTSVAELLPREVAGHAVVAALLDRKSVSLSMAVGSDCDLTPLTVVDAEGQRIYRQSLGLVLLEAAQQVAPELRLCLSHSVGFGQRVRVVGGWNASLQSLASDLSSAMKTLCEADAPLQEEWWTVDEAEEYFAGTGCDDVQELLSTWREPAVPLCSYGTLYVLRSGPLVHRTSFLHGGGVIADADGLILLYGEATSYVNGPAETNHRGAVTTRNPRTLTGVQQPWLQALGITSVGAFNRACIEGSVEQLIRVNEGFHEKALGQIADQIATQETRARVVCVAGPSSSGKTTFIKRLRVQLQVNGKKPIGISLDDYYVDRERSPRDARGQYDYEALAALRLDLLGEHLAGLLRGETVKTARYDFRTGLSYPEGGPEITLGPDDLLMLEGIHGLNPAILPPGAEEQSFRVYVCPLVQLPIDRLTRIHVSDLRLLRRMVRDRHSRNTDAEHSILRWPSVRAGEREHIFPFQECADAVFDSSLIYELSVLKVYAERYLFEVPRKSPAYTTAFRLLNLLAPIVTIYPDHVPPTSILREFIGDSGFEY